VVLDGGSRLLGYWDDVNHNMLIRHHTVPISTTLGGHRMKKTDSPYRAIGQRKRLSEDLVNQITDLILSKHLQPGDRLPSEHRLVEELGVSRSVVREGIKALEERGLVEVKQGSGTFVRSPSSEMVSDSFSLFLRTRIARYSKLMEVRGILDVEIAGLLAQRATEEDLERLSKSIERMWELLESPQEFVEEDVAFHMAFYAAMKNEVLLTIMQPIMEMLSEAMSVTFEAPGSPESSLRRHETLVQRIQAGDSEGAREAMREIIYRGEGRLTEALRAEELGGED
jgi:GntR family transcriptional repressor for pyruvate dehydrogenase complex